MRMFRLALLCALLGVPVLAQEQISLTAPETHPNTGTYTLRKLVLTFDDPATSGLLKDEGEIRILVVGANGEEVWCAYTQTTTPTATTLLTGLNKANMASAYANNATTGSLKQRLYHRLVVMNEGATVCGKAFVGTLTGSVP